MGWLAFAAVRRHECVEVDLLLIPILGNDAITNRRHCTFDRDARTCVDHTAFVAFDFYGREPTVRISDHKP